MLALVGSRVPAPAHSPMLVQTPFSEGQLGAVQAAHPPSQPCSRPWEKAAVMACPSEGAAGSPCFAAHPHLLQQKNCDIPHPPIGCGVCQLEEIFPQNAGTLPFMQRPTVSTAENISRLVISQHPPTPHCLQPLSSSLLSPRCLLCFAEELGRDHCLQCCPLAMTSVHPRSSASAQQQRTSSVCLWFFALWAHLRCLFVSRGTCCETG